MPYYRIISFIGPKNTPAKCSFTIIVGREIAVVGSMVCVPSLEFSILVKK